MRLIDCVGFMVEGASGHVENGEERLVKTPWFDYEIPFTQAAEIGTRKVIGGPLHHRHCGDNGRVHRGDQAFRIHRGGKAGRLMSLKSLGKPFIVLLNSVKPYSDDTVRLAREMSDSYGVSVLPVNCEQLKKDDIFHILERVLKEFPVTELDFYIPNGFEILPASHWLKAQVIQTAAGLIQKVIT